MINPLELDFNLPPFEDMKTEHIVPAMEECLRESQLGLDALLAIGEKTWGNFIEPLELIQNKLMQRWSPVSHLNSVMNSDELRKVYNIILPKLTNFYTELGQNDKLYNALHEISQSKAFETYNSAQKTLIENAIRDFKLSGVSLEKDKKETFKKLKAKMAELSSKFSENVLDCTHKWEYHIEDINELKGVPELSIQLFEQNAKEKDMKGYLVNLDFPCYQPIISYCENRALRKKMYHAYCTRASLKGPHPDKFDNSEIMDDILKCRREMASMLNFKNYGDYSIATKMAKDSDEVLSFLNKLASASKKQGETEFKDLTAFAKEIDGIDSLEAWDVSYYAEKLKEKEYSINQNELRPWFPLNHVLKALFDITEKLYHIQIVEKTDVPKYHKDVEYYELVKDGKAFASFYLDPYARKNKRGGAWMDECKVHTNMRSKQQQAVAYLVCNFMPPVGDNPALLTHDEVTTLFHEFGHGLHHMLTKSPYPSVSGINGVPWDAVELPSQFMENFCWDKELLKSISSHYKNNTPLSDEKVDQLIKAKNFQSAMMMLRQLEFAIFDFKIHISDQNSIDIQAILDRVRSEVSVVPVPHFNAFQHGFSHIFAGGYAAGYYSYKWAEVLSADAFKVFIDKGIFTSDCAKRFRELILEKGGSENFSDLFEEFLGRKPDTKALLDLSGIAA